MKRSIWIVILALGLALGAQASGGEDGKVDAIGHVMDGTALEHPGSHGLASHTELPHWKIGNYTFQLTRHMVWMGLAFFVILLVVLLSRSGKGMVPKGLYNMLESIVVFIRDEIAISSLGEKWGRTFTPYLLTVFVFVLAMNLIGLLPYGATATSNINVTFTLAALSLLMIMGSGMKAHGILGYWKHLVPSGVPLWLWPLMFVVELMGLFAKPFALMVRLFANMLAGHMVILSLLGLIFAFTASYGVGVGAGVAPVSVGFSLFVYLLELLVAFIQAYIFTFLTALFIGMAVHSH